MPESEPGVQPPSLTKPLTLLSPADSIVIAPPLPIPAASPVVRSRHLSFTMG
ncbi:MAG: hypothetical protein LAP85_17255 [Acidobacteriia bacterium]|nr:hypothetical protein [Terriglobia bacterium]